MGRVAAEGPGDAVVVETAGPVAIVRLARPERGNALDDSLLAPLEAPFRRPPAGARVIVLDAAGEDFCAGLAAEGRRPRAATEALLRSRRWHGVFAAIQFGGLPVVAVLKGAVVGAGLELAAATHVRIAEPSAFYALPETARGGFPGGGASVRVARLIGAGRLVEMMLTGRRLSAAEGQALGLSHELVGMGQGLARALELARRIAANPPLANYAVLQAIPRIEEMPMVSGLFTESLMSALTQSASAGLPATDGTSEADDDQR